LDESINLENSLEVLFHVDIFLKLGGWGMLCVFGGMQKSLLSFCAVDLLPFGTTELLTWNEFIFAAGAEKVPRYPRIGA